METLIDKILSIDYVAESVPLFLVLVAIEISFSIAKKRNQYQFGDTIANLSTGSISTIAANISKGLTLGVYIYLYNRFAIIHMEKFSVAQKWLAGLALLLTVDFLYYWFHRFTHRCNLGWIGHSVHHQSEEYNLSVALRQGLFQPQMSWVTYLPLAIVGFPPLWFVSMHALMTAYQFWIHTQYIKTMGPLEVLLNTPSHHRVHHGVNKKYQDKNYAGVLIIWDKLFGTFVPEDSQATYGTTTALGSWNPLGANFQHIFAIRELSKGMKSKWDRIRIWLMPPEWRPQDFPPCHFPTEDELKIRKKYRTSPNRAQTVIATSAFFIGLTLSVISLDLGKGPPNLTAILLGLVALGAYLISTFFIAKTEDQKD